MITGKLTPEDYISALRLNSYKVTMWLGFGCIVLMGVGITSVFAGYKWPALVFSSAGGGGLGSVLLSYFAISWRARKVFKQHRDFDHPFRYSWDSQFLYGEGVSGSSKRPWNHYVRVRENDEVFVLAHSDALFEMLPKRWFSSVEQIDEFRDLLMRKIFFEKI